jgi:D-sedoheptulose 7-phosphate isomerase
MNADSRITEYFRELAGLAETVADRYAMAISEIAELVVHTLANDGKLMFCGNGGSAADAQHLATEYVVRFGRHRPPLAAIALTTDTSLLTAAANDFGFEQIFARQVEALGRAGDLLFLHSTSGLSVNLLSAARAAKLRGVRTVALLARGGGALAAEVDIALILPTDNGAHAQEVHLAIGHVVCGLVEARRSDSPPATS